ncbi:hypothetical protein [Flavobacterium sp. K5-23]|uniref:hypothetical protein n=1 Tax=Flavobacterium sp. K5-23 TaxID=2746225 RepID=UPI00200E0EB7|nr:hypothetical protein [Flavobacterium sp. K5-23]UQD55794.1 hypothetical protein FLAK523_05030 [Flavobacterium sp. K5-23]
MKIRRRKNGTRKAACFLVYIGYFTSWVDCEGQVNFYDDIYGHDVKLAELLLTD